MREKDYQGELALSRQIIATQREQIVNLEAKVISLEAKVLILLKLQESQSIKKDSHNSSLPMGINAPIQYGKTVESLVSYLSVYQYLTFGRLQNLFTQVFSLPLSQGTMGNILQRTAVKCAGVYQMIKTQIAESQVVGSDETSTKVNGKKWWIWVWQNVLNTFIVASDNRGSETINNIWEIGLPNAVLVTDRGAAQLKSNTKGHQICLAHLLRNSIFLDESEKHPYSAQFKQFIIDVFDARKKLIIQKTPYQNDHQQAIDLEKKLNELLLMTIDKHLFPNTLTFQLSMLKLRNHLLPCLYNLDIPLTIMVLKEPFVISKSNKRSLGSLNQGKMLSVSCALS